MGCTKDVLSYVTCALDNPMHQLLANAYGIGHAQREDEHEPSPKGLEPFEEPLEEEHPSAWMLLGGPPLADPVGHWDT